MNFAAAYLGLAGVVTVGFGVVYVLRPKSMARMVKIELPTAQARADYRATYGGAQIGVGVFFLLAAWHATWRPPGLAAVSLFAFGFGVARLATLARERISRDPQWIVGALEIAAGVLGACLLLSLD